MNSTVFRSHDETVGLTIQFFCGSAYNAVSTCHTPNHWSNCAIGNWGKPSHFCSNLLIIYSTRISAQDDNLLVHIETDKHFVNAHSTAKINIVK